MVHFRRMEGAHAGTESDVRDAWERGDLAGATTAALRSYGPEVLGFLVAICKDRNKAEEAFSLFAETLWQGMSRFEWKCSVRTWAYLLARHAVADVHRRQKRDEKVRVAFSSSNISRLAARVRTETLSLLRTEKRSALASLRDELGEEDRALLVLRVDRGLAWRDIARVFGSGDDTLDREAARLRKRFQLVKERLRSLGKERGLV
jgi:RNA polymerase sigma-70 factor (ECF subfamily)